LFGAVASYIFNPITIAAGASGALLGLVGALSGFYLTMYKDSNARKNLYGLLFLVAINLVLGLRPGIDNWAHMGGLITGFFLGYFLTPVSGFLHPGFEGFYVINKFKNSFTRYAAILIVVFAILGGIWLGNATLPINTTTEVLKAEKFLKDHNYPAAIKNIEKAIEVGTLEDRFFLSRAYFRRAEIMVEYGNLEAAQRDLGYALKIADSETRRESIELLTEINDLR
jgi:tetratricopeptide (TPR) repeat protein